MNQELSMRLQRLNALRASSGKDPLSYETAAKMGRAKVEAKIATLEAETEGSTPEHGPGRPELVPPEKAPGPIEQAVHDAALKGPPVGEPLDSSLSAAVAAHDGAKVAAKATKPTSFRVVEDLTDEQLEALIETSRPETIVAMAHRLLKHVHRVDPSDKRTVGLQYASIVAMIRQKVPKAETSIECLRWYAVHMRSEGDRLPQKRPRPLVRD